MPDDLSSIIDGFYQKWLVLIDALSIELFKNSDLFKAITKEISDLNMICPVIWTLEHHEERCPAPVLQGILNLERMEGLFEFLDEPWIGGPIRTLKADLKEKGILVAEEDGQTHLPPFASLRPDELEELNERYQEPYDDILKILNGRFAKTLTDNFNIVLDSVNTHPIQTKKLKEAAEDLNSFIDLHRPRPRLIPPDLDGEIELYIPEELRPVRQTPELFIVRSKNTDDPIR